MSWVLVGGGVWLLLAVGAALLIGRSVQMADMAAGDGDTNNFVVDPALSPDEAAAEPPAPVVRTSRAGAIPATRPSVIRQCIPAEERAPSVHRSGIA